MIQNSNRLSGLAAGVLFILMVINDFFPGMGLSMTALAIGLVICILVAVFTRSKEREDTGKETYLIQINLTVGFFLLLVLLTVLGGESQRGIGLDGPFIWILIFGSLLYNVVKYKKMRTEEINRNA